MGVTEALLPAFAQVDGGLHTPGGVCYDVLIGSHRDPGTGSPAGPERKIEN